MHRTIVAVRGMFCGGWVWDRFTPILEERGFRVVRPTLRHHDVPPGDPPPPGLGRTSVLDYASDLEALARRLPEPPVVMGHSMGGLLPSCWRRGGLPAPRCC